MKRKLLPSVLFTAATVLFAAFSSFSQNQPWSQNVSPLPTPTGMVNDYAGVLDDGTKQQIEQKLRNFRDTSNPKVELAVAIVKTTGDRDIFDYSLAVARGWGIGSKDDNNPSALLFIAIDDRKYFTQISRDLEADLPDGAVGTIQRQYLVPEFKKQNYGKGISDTMDAYIATIRNKGNAPVAATSPTPSRGSSTAAGGSLIGALCCFGVVLLWIFISFFRQNRGGGSGHHWGGGFGSALPWVIGSVVSDIASSSIGSSSDSGGSSGGSDWGGFGGGGDFGGGGAGGDW
ncbi:MAG: TPM domain-containing protein [Acidobacteria bacterium]|nr:TPM domain-containing protein [Acidobacteriota bacterium]